MMREIQYPATRFPKILAHMLEESNQNLINTVFGALIAAKGTFLPADRVTDFCKEVTSFFLAKVVKEKANESLQIFCLDKSLSFIIDDENIRLAASWILEGAVTINGEVLSTPLTDDQKYAIVHLYYSSAAFTAEEKQALKEKAFAQDQSDKAHKAQQVNEYSLPDAALKEKLWNEIVDANQNDTLLQFQNKIAGFMNRFQQLDLITPYFEKYYDIVHDFVETRDREQAQIFIGSLSPAFLARDQDEQRFKALLEKANPEKHFYVQFLKQQLEAIDIIRRSRVLCQDI